MTASVNAVRAFTYNLYQEDPKDQARYGDKLLHGMRCMPLIYDFVINEPRDSNNSVIYDLALRVTAAALLVLMAIPAIVLGIVGMTIKALQKAPKVIPAQQPERATQQISDLFADLSCLFPPRTDLTTVEKNTTCDSNFSLELDTLPQEIWRQIFEYIHPSEYGLMIATSKAFTVFMQSLSIWQFMAEEKRFNAEGNYYEQCNAYKRLYASHDAGPANPFFDYLARRINGGPLAFSLLPITNRVMISPSDMTAPIVRAENRTGEIFHETLAICIKDENKDPGILYFYTSKKENPKRKKENPKQYMQIGPFKYWEPDRLTTSNTDHLNYVLAIINNDIERIEQLCEKDPILEKTVRLYDPNAKQTLPKDAVEPIA
ncbi:MAG: hypothetical protein ACXWM7_01095 [Parachlamydiaceae bacterium]